MDVSLKLNDLRNCAVDMTHLYKSSDGVHFQKINFKPIISKVKEEFNSKYVQVQAHLANSAICKHVGSFNSYVAHRIKVLMKIISVRLINRANMMINVYIILLYLKLLLLLLKRN